MRFKGKEYSAATLGNDIQNDIAVLKIDNADITTWIPIAPKMSANVGDDIYVIGFPLTDMLGNEPRVTDGIVSAKTGIDANPTRFQIDASIQPGNSGGPILDSNYNAIGIATEKLSEEKVYKETGSLPQNVNFGVKIEYAGMLLGQYQVGIESAHETSLESAIAATVEVIANPKAVGSNAAQYIAVQYSYQYSWDVMHYILQSLIIKWIDLSNGEVIGKGTHSGDTFGGYRGTTTKAIQSMLNSISK